MSWWKSFINIKKDKDGRFIISLFSHYPENKFKWMEERVNSRILERNNGLYLAEDINETTANAQVDNAAGNFDVKIKKNTNPVTLGNRSTSSVINSSGVSLSEVIEAKEDKENNFLKIIIPIAIITVIGFSIKKLSKN